MTKEQRKALAQFLSGECAYNNKFSDSERRYCSRKYEQRCDRNGNLWLDYVQCPKTCPHHPDNLHIECDGEKCAIIKKKLKQLEEIL